MLALDLVCPRVSNFLCVLNRNTNTTCSTGHDTGTTASPHCILLAQADDASVFFMSQQRSNKKHVTETAQRRSATHTQTHHKHRTEPWRNDISNFFPLARSFHTVLTSSAASEPQSHESVLGCRVMFSATVLPPAMRWRSAPVASAPSATQNSNSSVSV